MLESVPPARRGPSQDLFVFSTEVFFDFMRLLGFQNQNILDNNIITKSVLICYEGHRVQIFRDVSVSA